MTLPLFEPAPPAVGLALIFIVGATSQWVAWRVRLPSILLLLLAGFVAGPLTGLLDPDGLFGSVLLPFVGLSVAFVLLEGGLSLRFDELRGAGSVVIRLVTLGVATTWVVASSAAYWIVGLEARLAVLLGAILVVTGPTVIQPLLRHIRPVGATAAILKWEGIVIDPIGVLLTVIVFEAVSGSAFRVAPSHVLSAVASAVVLGGGIGALASGLLMVAIRRYWVPDALHNPVTLMLAAGAYVCGNAIQPEAGLFAATVMGIVLANQRRVDIRHIVEFKENLRTLLISALFIVLSARLRLSDFRDVSGAGLAFVLALIAARPLSVAISTMGSRLTRAERVFLMSMAPRGIVAASVASVMAIDLEHAGFPEARVLAPLTFLTIVVTVTVYGLLAGPIARRLGLAESDPQGLLIVGAHAFGRMIGRALSEQGFRVMICDNNPDAIATARLDGLSTHLGSILSDTIEDEIPLGGLGRLLALTPNNEVNVLAIQRFARLFGRAAVFQLVPAASDRSTGRFDPQLQGRPLFDSGATYAEIAARISEGAIIKATPLSETFGYAEYCQHYGTQAIPLFIVRESRRLTVVTADAASDPKPGDKLVALVRTGPRVESSAAPSVA